MNVSDRPSSKCFALFASDDELSKKRFHFNHEYITSLVRTLRLVMVKMTATNSILAT